VQAIAHVLVYLQSVMIDGITHQAAHRTALSHPRDSGNTLAEILAFNIRDHTRWVDSSPGPFTLKTREMAIQLWLRAFHSQTWPF